MGLNLDKMNSSIVRSTFIQCLSQNEKLSLASYTKMKGIKIFLASFIVLGQNWSNYLVPLLVYKSAKRKQ